jgi:hypothetical protein
VENILTIEIRGCVTGGKKGAVCEDCWIVVNNAVKKQGIVGCLGAAGCSLLVQERNQRLPVGK